MVHLFVIFCFNLFQTLDPSERIPDDMYELGFSEEVLEHECPDYLKDVKDEEVTVESMFCD